MREVPVVVVPLDENGEFTVSVTTMAGQGITERREECFLSVLDKYDLVYAACVYVVTTLRAMPVVEGYPPCEGLGATVEEHLRTWKRPVWAQWATA